MAFMMKEEQDFLFDYIKNTKVESLLEYGSGASTTELQEIVKELTSVEHDPKFFNMIMPQLKDNVTYLCAEPDNPEWENQFDINGNKNTAGDDGTFDDFANYVTAPLLLNKKFDCVFIDGRARAACAFVAANLLVKDKTCSIFIHDYGYECKHPTLGYRTYYNKIGFWLKLEEIVGTMARFVPK